MVNTKSKILVVRSCSYEKCISSIEWIKREYENSIIYLLVQNNVMQIKRDEYAKVYITKVGPLTVQTVGKNILEDIGNEKIDVMIIPVKEKRFNNYDNIITIGLYCGIKTVILWDSEKRQTVLKKWQIPGWLGWKLLCKSVKYVMRRLLSFAFRRKSISNENQKKSLEVFDPIFGRALHKGVAFGKFKGSLCGYCENDPPVGLSSLEPSDKLRVIVLGGSTVYGVGLKDPTQTIATNMSSFIKREHGIDAEVLNYGISGGWSRSESSMLIYKLIYAQPDIVISFSGWNDFATQWSMQYRYGQGSEVLNWTFFDYYHYLLIHAPYEIGAHEVPFVEKEFIKENFVFLDSNLFPHSSKQLAKDLWSNNLSIMSVVCERYGSTFLGVLQPHILLQGYYDEIACKQWLKNNLNFYFARDINEDRLWSEYCSEIDIFYQYNRRRLKELQSMTMKSYYEDFSCIFKEQSENCFADIIHYNENGTRIIARKLVSYLAQKGLLTRHREKKLNG